MGKKIISRMRILKIIVVTDCINGALLRQINGDPNEIINRSRRSHLVGGDLVVPPIWPYADATNTTIEPIAESVDWHLPEFNVNWNLTEMATVDAGSRDDFGTWGDNGGITIHQGDILDGISVDGQLFGSDGGSPHQIRLALDERVRSLDYGFHRHSYWKGTMCNLLINTNKTTYGLFANDFQCGRVKEHIKIPSGSSFKQFLKANSSKT